jgi:copper transport protein
VTPWLGRLGAVAIAASFALTGHAATAALRAPAGTALGAHALAAAFWFGSLVALHAVLTRDAAQAGAALRRFSGVAAVVVAILALAGALFAALQLRSLAALAASPYGRLVLLKVALFAALLGLAAANRFVLMPRLARGAAGAGAALRRVIAAEAVLVVAVLAATAALVQTSPHGGAVSRTLQARGYAAALTLAPARPGRNALSVVLQQPDGRPVDPAAVEASVSHPAGGIEAITRPLRRVAPGRYTVEALDLPLAGAWRIEIRARLDDFEQVRWTTDVDLR